MFGIFSVLGFLFVRYRVAGMVLAPSVVWLSIASCLVYSIWTLNGREGMIPMTKKKEILT
jgi:tryptophan-rich sensory protein